MSTETKPFGSWPSPITASRLVEGAAAISEVRVDGTDVWWNEQRPSEGGRHQLVRRGVDGVPHDLFPPFDPDGGSRNWNARTAVMEYGGGAWNVRGGTVLFTDWSDQRLYRVDAAGGTPEPITPEPRSARGLRWSEPTWVDDDWIVCIRESHEPEVVRSRGEAANHLVALPLDGSAVDDPSLVRVLASGPDFVHSPAVLRDVLAWVQWSHPDMPWDSTTLVVGRLVRDDGGSPAAVTSLVEVAGGPRESVVQPGFTASGDLVFCTDRTDWWNPWRVRRSDLVSSLGEVAPAGVGDGRSLASPVLAGGGAEVEIGGGLWVGGLRWWAEIGEGRMAVSATSEGADRLAVIEADGTFVEVDTPFTEIAQVVATGHPDTVALVASSPVTVAEPLLVTLGPRDGAKSTASAESLRPDRDLGFDESWLSRPRHVSFPSGGADGRGRTAHALYYPPTNPAAEAPSGDLPPLIVTIHGGPTSAARHRLDLAKQFWTSRGFALVDVNYGGSTGYGRPYRRLLDGQWGIVDVEDAVAAARFLAREGLVDQDRLAIRGGSAGGYTTLAALCFHDSFGAGASHYGVADLSALAADTHKFESRYLDGLVGPWPEAEDIYRERSPIHHTAGFDRPLIVLQGSEDEVVPPNQAEMIVAALAAKGVPHAYLLFEGEQHGFRRAENIVRALESELWFYGRVFDFEPADDIVPVEGAVGL